ncbi:MAG: sugar ABC transporter permease [Chloroflexota bacterium]|nr:sugar ABC transporter permease [Chloroflexota bacterium]
MQDTPALEISEPRVASAASPEWRAIFGRTLIRVTSLAVLALIVMQFLKTAGVTEMGFANWRPVAVALLAWSASLCLGMVLSRGQHGERAVFLLPAVLLTVAFVIFPTIYALFIAFNSWNLSAAAGRQFNGLDNYRQLLNDGGYWNAMKNMGYYVAAVLAQYVIAYLLAILLNQNIRGRKFFRVVFLLPFMLSPVAVSFMIGKSILNSQYGPIIPVLEALGFTNISFYEDPWLARLNIMMLDAWYSIPFMMVLLLAGLQAIPFEVLESAKIDGASSLQTFLHMIFPLMLPVSLTAIILRVIFELKLIDVVRVVTGGGPGSATDTISLFIYREGIQKTNVGYATALSQFYLLIIIIAITVVLWVANKWVEKVT